MTFFFTSPQIEVMEKMSVYGVDNFFSDFGGFLRLFLGASCFTVVDILAKVFEVFAEKRRQKKATKTIK